jgi:2-keto-4-pentenoate hydratase
MIEDRTIHARAAPRRSTPEIEEPEPMTFDPTPAARQLAAAMNTATRIAELAAVGRPSALAEAYAVQERIAADAGKPGGVADEVVGWKLGIGSKNAMQKAGLASPVIGRLFGSRVVADGASVALPAGAPAMVEIEIAFRLARDVAPGERLASPLDAVADAHIVSELVVSRLVDRVAAGLPSFVADSVGFHALIVGAKVPAASIARIAASAIVHVDGKETARGLAGDDAIDPVTALGQLMAHAAERGQTLRAGELVTTGTLTRPFDAPAPARVTLTADGAALAFQLV